MPPRRAWIGSSTGSDGDRICPRSIRRWFDLTALTSFDEGTPVSLLESLASGTPVVSRAVGGVPEMLEGDSLGRLVWSAFADELADVLETALRDPPSAETRETARKRVLEHYSIERLVGDMERLYTEALGRVGVALGESR